MIAILDYGVGNPSSIRNMLKKLSVASVITSDPSAVAEATKLILPGVGAFDAARSRLLDAPFLKAFEKRAREDKVPVLGICIGMQLLTKSSEEGRLPGLGWVDAVTRRFPAGGEAPRRVPHMGWNTLELRDNPLFRDFGRDSRFYFVHSYFVDCASDADVIARTHYGISFVSALNHENIWGVQFHPEKSHRFGMALLKNFAEL